MRPSFIRVILASGSVGLAHSAFETRFPARLRSSWRNWSRARLPLEVHDAVFALVPPHPGRA